MADNKNNFIPRSSAIDDSDSTNVAKFLPAFYRTDANKKFFKSTLTQLTQPGAVNKVSGYVGRKTAKQTTSSDVFVNAPTKFRQNYQLEPGFVIDDDLDNTVFLKDYQDYINQLKVFGANVGNHTRLNSQEVYSWNPHIDWDKFVNFQNYYWMPNGADTVDVSTEVSGLVLSTYTVGINTEGYVFSSHDELQNPTITLYKGYTYYFNINTPGVTFSIKTSRVASVLNRYSTPTLLNNSIDSGMITFTVPYDAPTELFYVNERDVNFGGVFIILDPLVSGELNVVADIIGKQTYTFNNDVSLSNGMKVRFVGNVYPEEYRTGRYYVEGVGESIQLINESQLEIITPYTTSEAMLFDTTQFDTTPFSDAVSYSGKPDYIVINRGSIDKNGWSRNNRWIHKSVITASAEFNGLNASFNELLRAVRPIIEFEKNLKLFNFGTTAIADIDVIDNFTSDAFSIVEGSLGYNVDGVTLTHGQRIIFTADTDMLVANNIYRVEFIDVRHLSSNSKQIRLELDTIPTVNDVVLVKEGKQSQGTMHWFNGSKWITCQQKTSLNQLPMFDVFDENWISFGDNSAYPGTTFKGTSIFSYKVGAGITDTNLGFALSYKNISNIGDIVFNYSLLSDLFQYEDQGTKVTRLIHDGFLYCNNTLVNGWETYKGSYPQAALRLYRNVNKTNYFDIDIFDTLPDAIDARVYLNGGHVPQFSSNSNTSELLHWRLVTHDLDTNALLQFYQVVFVNYLGHITDISVNDTVLIKVYSNYQINTNGYYEIPINIQNNPLNGELSEFTLGEVIDHVDSIVDNLRASSQFVGLFPGNGNLRDLGNVSKYGTKFVQHSGPASLSVYHITSAANNVIRAIEQSRDDYSKFKRSFINVAETLGVDLDPVSHVDLILRTINNDSPVTSPYYYSDMIPTGAKTRTDFTVVDPSNTIFSLVEVFSLSTLSNKAVSVYLNDIQLLHGKEYTFSNQGFVIISAHLNTNDTVSIFEYASTDGSLVPETPTKLGMWPKYEPKIYLDTTLITPKLMIQGHDGSLIVAYGDYRDDLILELEKRIYNNIKVSYDEHIFDIQDVIPCYYRKNDYTLSEFNSVLQNNFYTWVSTVGIDFSTPLTYDIKNPFTFNYKDHIAPDGQLSPKYWRGIYQWMLGTDRPHICPWEMLGFSEEPMWWVKVYGPAPYTCDNLVLWTDLSEGVVRNPAGTYRSFKHIKPDLLKHIPVDSNGRLVDPRISNFTSGIISQSTQGDFTFGDVSPLESAWRRHSHYPFSVIKTSILLTPAKTISLLIDRSRIKRNVANQLVYSETGLRIRPSDILLPSVYLGNNRIQTAGLVNYLVNYLNCETLTQYNQYAQNLKLLTSKICYRVSGFTSAEKFKLLLDSKSPTTVGSVFIPQEDYKIVLNTSSPIATITYSGVIITKVEGGFEIKGYSKVQPYFKYYEGVGTGIQLNIGGISEGYSEWGALQTFVAGKIVQYNTKYYRVTTTHVASDVFDNTMFAKMGELPIVGGVTAGFKQQWVRVSKVLLYGSKLTSIQEVVDFLLGYGQWLIDQGFIFNDFNTDLRDIANWETSAKEFMFWTNSNWKSMDDAWYEWTPYNPVQYGDIVRFNGSYYRALRSMQLDVFNINDYTLLPGLDIVGTAVLSVSPAANKLTFAAILSVVDDMANTNNICELLDVAGTQITVPMLQLYRTDTAISYQPKDDFGIYCATFYLVQREHVVILNNSTMFNDTIYNLESGYKQDKIKVSGYVSTQWNGSLNVPGFVVDQAKILEWTPWQSYSVSDIVYNRSFYYSAKQSIHGDETFIDNHWIKLPKKPISNLLPNWNYKATQFTDFYSLDSENFDVGQQRMAQHLTGYQKRQYLENIIQDDVSEFKFYQGMILEKGTQNVLNKLFDVLSSTDDRSSLQFYEEWAVRSGQYGACDAFETVEFVLDEALFKTNPQGFKLVDNITQNSDLIIRQLPTDLVVKPLNYKSSAVWPVATPVETPTAIYARLDEVTASVKSIDTILTLNSLDFSYGNYVLCTFTPTGWSVFQYVTSTLTIHDITQITGGLKITVNESLNLANGDIVVIKDTTHTLNSALDSFFIVNNTSTIDKTFTIVIAENIVPPLPFTNIQLGVLKSRRISTIDDNNYLYNELSSNSLAWVDNEHSQWETWKYNPVYKVAPIVDRLFNNAVGNTMVSANDGNLVAVLTSSGVFIFRIQRTTNTNKPIEWVTRQKITVIATTISLSKDGKWLAVGNVNTGLLQIYKNNTGDIFDIDQTFTHTTEQFGKSLTFDNNILFVGTNVGKLYSVSYNTSNQVESYYNPNGSGGNILVVSDTTGITVGMSIHNVGFTQGQTVIAVLDLFTVMVSAPQTSTPSGIIVFITKAWELSTSAISGNLSFGTAVVTSDNNKLAILETGVIYVYDFEININLLTSITVPYDTFAESIAISKNAEYIAVSGNSSVSVYKLNNTVYELASTLENPTNTTGIYNASRVQFTNDYATIVVKGETTIDIFDIYKSTWKFSERIILPASTYGNSIITTPTSIIVNSSIINKVYHYVKPHNQFSWTVQHYAILKPNISKIKQALLYDRTTNELVKYLDIVDPVQEKFPNIIEREIKFKTMYDPAVYSIGNSTVNVDEGLAWAELQVGTMWWDKRTTKFMDNYTDNVVYRTSVWSTLAPGASVDVYEWVKSELKPSDWDDEADTEVGLAAGISGKSLYSDNAYSVVSTYDTLGQRVISTYYFWVKNKTTISVNGRQLSANDASGMIANPRGEGYQCLVLTGVNSFSLVNVRSLLKHQDIVLLVEYWTIDKTDQNIHTQWKLISAASQTTLPNNIEQKWINSLCGKDEYNRLVPDQKIPIKLRYGIENRPLQSMFVNRFEALKQYIEEVNRILINELIVDTRDLSNLDTYDIPPAAIRCLYDTVIDTDAELRFVLTKNFVTASVVPVIKDGKIVDVTITNSGRGYLVAPFVNVYGDGINAKIKTEIDLVGRIINCVILNSGEGYLQNTVLTVRSYSALVNSDSQAHGKWSIYAFEPLTGVWSKVISQAYDTTQYWYKVDWYSPKYNHNQFTAISHSVDTYADLYKINVSVGQIVKVLTTTSNRWVLLEKWQDVNSLDWTQSYNVIGSQLGTIQFSSTLYNALNTAVGFDGMLYDSGVYDVCASVELRIILNAIKNDLLVGIDLKPKYLNLFFASVRYAMSEQTYVDWIFKTSFVNVVHNVGNLHQSVTYKNDNLSNFEDYVSEVKPYRTQVREYISAYTSTDTASLTVTDFDLPVVYNLNTKKIVPVNATVVNDVIIPNNYAIDTYPWAHWVNNVGFSVIDIRITESGSGYAAEPVVTIVSNSGSGATARAFISNGKVIRIKVLTAGTQYLSAPTVIITGGVSNTGTPALASAIIGNSVVRTNLINLKFDRVTQTQTITELQQEETISVSLVTGKRVQFPIKWAPDIRIGQHSVTINGVLEIRDRYTLQIVKSIVNGHTEYTGSITFDYTPAKDSIIVVTYLKDVTILNAVDRIEHYYDPMTGELGKDLSQLMTGIDYGGVEVSGLNFNVKHGWDSYTYDTIKWDNANSKFNDVKFIYTERVGTDVTIQFPESGFEIPAAGTLLTVYYDANPGVDTPVRIDNEWYNNPSNNTDPLFVMPRDAVMQSPVSTGDITDVVIPQLFFEKYFDNLSAIPDCTFFVREYASDGTDMNDNDYDVAISGGALGNLSTASGLLPEDIVIEGDKFENIFAGPEEIVPGQVVDSVAIKIYTLVDGVTHSYMQFKDILNRMHYKRLPASKTTTLAATLLNTDTAIILTDVSMLDQPNLTTNKPGVLEIKGERIEYFVIDGTSVTQLRRGTLGTSIPEMHYVGSTVQVIGLMESLPYTESTITETHSKLTNTVVEVNETSNLYDAYGKSIVVSVSFRPKKSSFIWAGAESASLVSKGFGQCDDIEVFVGGYDGSTRWSSLMEYGVDDIIIYGSYTYKCKTAHTSSLSFSDDYSNWDFFVGNIRLQKSPYTVYNERLGIDELFPADFSVNGIFKTVRLSNTFTLAPNTIITVIKRTGNIWVDDQSITNFINAVPGAEYVSITPTYDDSTDTFDDSDIQF